MRTLSGATGSNELYFLHADHLGSTSLTTNMSQAIVGQQRYYAYGEPRNGADALHTDRRFTDQREESGLGSLYDYNARYYSPLIGRFISADTIVPGAGNPQALNRYAYTLNNPLKYTDPSGHWVESAIDLAFIAYDLWDFSQNGLNWENGLSLAADVAGLLLPVATGGGLAVRAAFHADDAAKALTHLADLARAANHLTDTGRTLDNLTDAAATVCSFSAETPVSTPNGQQPISALKPGEMVLAYHEGLGATGYYTVTATWSHVDPVIVELTIDGESVQTTPEHPFFTAEQGWVAAGGLWLGAQVAQAGGGYGVVEGVAFKRQPQAMYNLTVAGAHTYFVGERQWLVHNACSVSKGPEILLGLQERASRESPTLFHAQMNLQRQGIDAKIYSEWQSVGLTSINPSVWKGTFAQAFSEAANNTSRIHFDLTSFDHVSGWRHGNTLTPRVPHVTDWEFYQIMTNPDWLRKTTFWKDGAVFWSAPR